MEAPAHVRTIAQDERPQERRSPQDPGKIAALSLTRGSFEDSTDLIGRPDALRDRARRDGFLFFRSLIPVDAVHQVRRDILRVVERHGWILRDSDPILGYLDVEALSRIDGSEMRTDIGVTHEAYHDVQRLESVHELPHHPAILHLYRSLFGNDILVHPRHIIRMVTPHPSVFPTPQHQDFPLIQGTPNTWTCWFPVGDCPRALGSLSVLRGSHRNGYLPIEPAPGAGGIAAQLCAGEDDWVEGDFQAGDVLTFSSLTVHRALPSTFRDRIRLSFDVRYQPIDQMVEVKSLQPHCALSWEEIYAGWQSEEFQYYWKRLSLHLSPWDTDLLQPARRIC